MSITPLTDAFGYIERNVGIFFRSGRANALECATSLVSDAIISGVVNVGICRHDPWWLVGAETDWLAHPELRADELFARIVPFPIAGPNSIRSEVLLGTFAQSIILLAQGDKIVLRGDAIAAHELESELAARNWKRGVAFQLKASHPAF